MANKVKIAILFFIIAIVCTILFVTFKRQKRIIKERWAHEIKGKINKISSAGKGSYQIIVTVFNSGEDTIYWRGLGAEKKDIIIGDSIAKNANDHIYYIYRKINNKYDLVYEKELDMSF
jgi:hypothetical protein